MNNMPLRFSLAATAIAHLACASGALAGEPVFELGAIQVSAPRTPLGEIGEEQVASVVTRTEMQRHNRENVADALNLLPGVSVTNGTRNEKMVNVRGYDARQVPLYIDGIPVYVPYDGYVDFSRFSTFDLAAIQLVKGFSSVAYPYRSAPRQMAERYRSAQDRRLTGQGGIGAGRRPARCLHGERHRRRRLPHRPRPGRTIGVRRTMHQNDAPPLRFRTIR